MNKCWLFALALLGSGFYSTLLPNEANASTLETINRTCSQQEKKINKGTLNASSLIIKNEQIQVSEGVLPTLTIYHMNDRPIAAYITAGHETWSKSFYYCFDKKGRIMKYLEVIDRPDNPPRRAIIYNPDGSVIWKNIDEAEVSPQKIVNLFKTLQSHMKAFSSY